MHRGATGAGDEEVLEDGEVMIPSQFSGMLQHQGPTPGPTLGPSSAPEQSQLRAPRVCCRRPRRFLSIILVHLGVQM
jgi:hypothetical protein